MPVQHVKIDRNRCFRYFDPCPEFSLRHMPVGSSIIMRDGGFWVVDAASGIRYRRITMDDLPKHVCWNTRGPSEKETDQ